MFIFSYASHMDSKKTHIFQMEIYLFINSCTDYNDNDHHDDDDGNMITSCVRICSLNYKSMKYSTYCIIHTYASIKWHTISSVASELFAQITFFALCFRVF